MQQHSQDAKDGVIFNTAAIKIGGVGMDLRQPASSETLADLINARFTTRYTRRRNGHFGYPVVDGAVYPDNAAFAPAGWLYGHGQTITELLNTSKENDHYPVAGQAQGTFNFRGARVVWTGDRLLTLREDNTALGRHEFWDRDGAAALNYGVPAMLPIVDEMTPPKPVGTSYLNTCLTDRYRVNVWYAQNGLSLGLTAQVINRETGALVFEGDISGVASNDPIDSVVFQSGNFIVCLWRDFANNELYLSSWTGVSWTTPTLVQADVSAFAVAVVSGGFHLVWAVKSTGAIKIGKYSNTGTQSTPYAFNTQLVANGANGDLAVAVAPDGSLGVLWSTATQLLFREYSSAAVAVGGAAYVVDGNGAWVHGLSVCSRALRRTATKYDWVIHAGRNESVRIASVYYDGAAYQKPVALDRHNSRLASKSFRVGDEVFCWLRAGNSETHYLIGGAHRPQVAGVADRQVALTAEERGGVYGVPYVFPDFADTTGYRFTWIRPFNTGVAYRRGGNALYGDMNFLPALSAVHFGKSTYLSGSCVKNWDGQELLEAGFHDYPKISSATNVAGGSFSALAGNVYIRVYAVRYNALGERFQSAALTHGPVVYNGASEVAPTRTIAVSIKTTPVTSTENVELEVWVTDVGGTTFYYHGSVKNDLSGAIATYSISTPRATNALIDPHETGIGQLEELEEWGPVGCSILAVVGDRIWSAGGQVPRGSVQFSKLKEPLEGVGHDDIAQFYEVDTTGKVITSIAGFNEVIVAFSDDRISLIPPPGPDNYGRGNFPAPQVVLADGASTHAGTALVNEGLVYWSSHGPMLLSRNLQTVNISAAVQPLAETMTPTGVRVDFDNSEVIWFTKEGGALLVNYLDGIRWARWTGLPAAAITEDSIITPSGTLLVESENAYGDNGCPYQFGGRLGWVRPEDLLQGHTRFKEYGFAGEYLGEHTLRFRVFYDGAALWNEEQRWTPDANNWLTTVAEVAALTPAQVDALTTRARSGRYGFRKRAARQDCERFSIEWSDIASDRPTYVPHEISVELGALPGHGRGVINTFSGSVAR